jgi:cold shock CspA family protein
VEAFLADLCAAHLQLGVALSVADASARLDAAFGVDNLEKELGLSVAAIVERIGKYHLVTEGGEVVIVGEPVAVKHDARRQRGRVANLTRDGRSGFIAVPDDVDVYFTLASVRSADRELVVPGATVEFSPRSGASGPFAERVVVIDAPERLVGGCAERNDSYQGFRPCATSAGGDDDRP